MHDIRCNIGYDIGFFYFLPVCWRCNIAYDIVENYDIVYNIVPIRRKYICWRYDVNFITISHRISWIFYVLYLYRVCKGQEEDDAGREGKALDGTRGTEMHATNCVPEPNLCTC